jgi:hypothetical protein
MMDITVTELREAVRSAGSIRAAEKILRGSGITISARTIRRRLQDQVAAEFEVDAVPSPQQTIESLIAERTRKFQQLKSHTGAARIRTVRLRSNEIIGLGFFGDPHIDDDGTNLPKLLAHAALFDGRQQGLHGVLLGDILNNWVGRLERLWADQSVNAVEAQALVVHFLDLVKWMVVVFGNHDVWNHKIPLYEYFLQATTIHAAHEQRVRLLFPNGRQVIVHARHKFPGHSQWTRQFGQIKAATLGGDADIYIGGDKHVSGYSNGWHEGQRRMWHAVQVASYKEIDEYPVELGLMPADLYQCPVALINPQAADPLNFIRWEFDPNEGATRLAWERKRHSN